MSYQSNSPTFTSTEAETLAATQLTGLDIMSIAESSGATVVDSTDVNTGRVVRRKNVVKNASLSDLAHIVQSSSKNSLASADAMGFTSVIDSKKAEIAKIVSPLKQEEDASPTITDQQKAVILGSLQEIAALAEKQATMDMSKEEIVVMDNSDTPAKKTRKKKSNDQSPSSES